MPRPQDKYDDAILALRQCQKCYVPENKLKEVGRALQTCSGCKKILYCSRECQKGDWEYHKTFCNLNKHRRDVVHTELPGIIKRMTGGHTLKALERRLRDWLELNRRELQKTAVDALNLAHNTDNLFTHLFFISLTANFDGNDRTVDSKNCFSIQVLEPALISDWMPPDEANRQAFEALLEKSRNFRANGWVGLVLMIITVTAPLRLDQVSPFVQEVVERDAYNPNWKATFIRQASSTPGFVPRSSLTL